MTTLYDTQAGAVETPDADLFARLDAADEEVRERVRETLVRRYRWLVDWAAHRYGGRGEEIEELEQVGYVGLVEAIDRFDVHRGIEFITFARPTVLGEIRRHFRDRRRWVRLPRKLQERKTAIREATDALRQRTGREPSSVELARYLEITEGEVTEALAVDDAFEPMSLDSPITDSDDRVTFGDLLVDDDGQRDDLVDSAALWPLLEELPEREQQMVLLRYFGNKTQSEIADRLGISQMHVSRLLQRTLEALRQELVSDRTTGGEVARRTQQPSE